MALWPLLMLGAAGVSTEPLPAGLYTNEEDAYFAKEAGKPALPWLGMRIDAQGGAQSVDPFGQPVGQSVPALRNNPDGTIRATLADGRATILRRARSATCWSALRKEVGVVTLPAEWHFERGIRLHDQGGRAAVGDDIENVQPVVLRMRNVVWASGPNRPSLVLYVHAPDNPDAAVAYAWADPGATRIGINLRWMQASCTIDGADAPPAPHINDAKAKERRP